MNALVISAHHEFPCFEASVGSEVYGQLAYYVGENLELSWWGRSNNMVFNRILAAAESEMVLNICYKFEGSDYKYRSIRVNPPLIKDSLIVGVSPYGEICLWDGDSHSTRLVERYKISNDPISNDRWFKQYTYRFVVDCVGIVDGIDKIKSDRFDGSFDEFDDSMLGRHAPKSLPRRVVVGIKKGNITLHIYLWFEFEEMYRAINSTIYAHPETKTDFIISIDAENKKYGLALYRQGLKEPVAIPESAYQLIVFKNKFEDYRSENYNQPRGAWIW